MGIRSRLTGSFGLPIACALAMAVGAAACYDQPTSPPEAEETEVQAAAEDSDNADLEGKINRLINAIFPPGKEKQEANKTFSDIKSALAQGNTDEARSQMFDFVDGLLEKARAGELQDPKGERIGPETAREGAAKLTRLYFEFVGLEAPPITAKALQESGGADVVSPGEATRVETGDKTGAVDVPSDGFQDPALVTLEKREDPPEAGKGPIPLTLEGKQYGPFYNVETSTQPDGDLVVGTCVPTSGPLAPPSDEQDDLKLVKSTDEPGEPKFLPPASTTFLDCEADELALAGKTESFSTFGAGNELGADVVAKGKGFTCALREDDQAFCWGRHENTSLGEKLYLGNDTIDSSISTTPVPVMQDGVEFDTLVAGEFHACGLASGNGTSSDGTAYCWGENRWGQLGDGSTTNSTTPTKVDGGHSFDQISAGGIHSCAVDGSNSAYCWGSGGFAKGSLFTLSGKAFFHVEDSPIEVATGHDWQAIDAGRSTNCAITTTNDAYCWGNNAAGSLGNGELVLGFGDPEPTPQLVKGGHTFDRIATGHLTACGITTGDVAYCWGLNGSGQLGIGVQPSDSDYQENNETEPAKVGGHSFKLLDANQHNHLQGNVCGITTGNVAYCWGDNMEGQLAVSPDQSPESCIGRSSEDPPPACSIDPFQVSSSLQFSDLGVVTGQNPGNTVIDDHASATCGVTTAGEVYCWGSNDFGQLGDGTTTDRHSPTKVSN